MFLGRVEGLENLADLLVRDTGARIDHRHFDRGILDSCRPNGNSPLIQRDVGHGIHRVCCQVQ